MSISSPVQLFVLPRFLLLRRPFSPPLRLQVSRTVHLSTDPAKTILHRSNQVFPNPTVSPPKHHRARVFLDQEDESIGQKDREEEEEESDDLCEEGEIFQKTLRLVECSMLASVTGLAYFLSSSLALENYISCFFSLPVVISCMRWGLTAGRKTMVGTALLLFILSGPIKASTYLLMHGLVGLAMGSLWRMRINWGVSLAVCTLARMIGALGYILLTSFLIRENILNLITINVHASLTYVLTAVGLNVIPTMNAIYVIFGIMLFLNCGFFVLLLHILYAAFLIKLEMKASLELPEWLEKAV